MEVCKFLDHPVLLSCQARFSNEFLFLGPCELIWCTHHLHLPWRHSLWSECLQSSVLCPYCWSGLWVCLTITYAYSWHSYHTRCRSLTTSELSIITTSAPGGFQSVMSLRIDSSFSIVSVSTRKRKALRPQAVGGASFCRAAFLTTECTPSAAMIRSTQMSEGPARHREGTGANGFTSVEQALKSL